MFDRNKFSLRLKSLRIVEGVSGFELSIAVGLKSKGSISQFETGLTTPSADSLVALADFFGVSMDYLSGRTDNPQENNFAARRAEVLLKKEQKKEQEFLETLPAELLPAYLAAKEKNPENLQQIIKTFLKMAKDFHSLTK